MTINVNMVFKTESGDVVKEWLHILIIAFPRILRLY